MPSILVGQPVASGPQQVIIGNPFSGSIHPIGGILFTLDYTASGAVYMGINASGTVTLTSGGFFLSGNTPGINDGFQIKPGATYFVHKTAMTQWASGVWPIYIRHDAACSGQARLYYEWQF